MVVSKGEGMNILIVEDDFASRKLLMVILSPYGQCDVAVDGEEAIHAFEQSVASGERYDLVCLDIMLPRMDGQQVLKRMREIEADRGISWGDREKSATILMTTALDDAKNFMDSMRSGCEGYLPKPITKKRLLGVLREFGLIS